MKLNVQQVIDLAGQFKPCGKLNGVDNWKKLIRTMFSAQGREFCENNKFPTLEQFRAMDEDLSRHKLYIDAGEITINNCKNVLVAGNTRAVINIFNNTRVTKIMVMHGASAVINASNYAVILLVNIDGQIEINNDQTAKILQ